MPCTTCGKSAHKIVYQLQEMDGTPIGTPFDTLAEANRHRSPNQRVRPVRQ